MKYLYHTCILFLLGLIPFSIHAQDLENLDEIGERKFLDFKGSFSVSSNYYISTREFNQQNPFRYVLSGNPVLSVYGFDVPLSFTFANSDFAFSGPDNFQRFGISPYYKWIKIHAGYSNVSFSPYTLNNHNFLGGGVELNPGNWRFGVVYGRFTSPIAEDTTSSQTLPPSYKRTGLSFKIGYGTNDNYVELSVLSARDHPNSIPDPVQSNISPARNLAIGLKTRQTLFDRLVWELNIGSSAYTDDVQTDEVEPGERNVPGFMSDIFQPHVSTRLNFAGHTSLSYTMRMFSVRAEYKRIDPEYETMGSYYFNNDLERYSLSPTVSLFRGNLSVGGSIGYQRDNLLDNKAATTKRIIGSANIQASPFPQFSVSAQYGNYATEQEAGMMHLNDTIRIFQVNHNINLTPAYVITGDRYYHNFVLSLGNQTLVDRNIFTEEFTESETNNANFNYRFRDNTTRYGLSAGLNYLTLSSQQTEITRYGASAGASKELFEDKFNVRINGMFNFSQREKNADGFVVNANVDIGYNPHPMHSFSLRGNAILNRTSAEYTDYILSANYTFTL